jgi:chromosome segregation and condensation protein ScpB
MMIWMTICTFGLIWLVIVATMSAEEIYDDPYTRFARVRYELINQLRASSLPQKQIMEIIDQTDLIKKVQARYNENEHRSSMWLRVAGIFRRGLRDDLAMEYLEKDLEKLANNDLFVSSARLKTIGT